jgi:hypothetical protein
VGAGDVAAHTVQSAHTGLQDPREAVVVQTVLRRIVDVTFQWTTLGGAVFGVVDPPFTVDYPRRRRVRGRRSPIHRFEPAPIR